MKRIVYSLFSLFISQYVIAQAPTNGLVAYYPFSGNANDASSSGNHGMVTGATLSTDRFGNTNQSYFFDGASIITASDNNLPLGNSPRTLSAWVYCGQRQSLIHNGNPAHLFKYGIELAATNYCNTALWGDVLRFSNNSTPPDADYVYYHPINEWFNILIRLDVNNRFDYFINGQFVFTADYEIWNTISDGNILYGEFLSNGKLDEIRIYNRALADQEKTQLYQAEAPPVDILTGLVAYYPFNGNVNDESANGNHGTNNNASLAPDRNGSLNKAMQFDGVNSYISVANSTSLESPQNGITIAAWEKYTEYNQGHSIVCKSDQSGTSPFQYRMGINYTGPFLGFQNTPGSWQDINPSNPIPLDEWKYIVSTYDGTYAKFYVDGNLVSTTPFAGHIYPDSKALEIGRDIHGGTDYFKGYIDEIKIFNRALTQQEALSLYNNVAAPCSLLNPEIISSSLEATTRPNGNIQFNANVTTCPATINIIEFRYWFDGNINNPINITTTKLNYLNFDAILNCESLNEGSHTLNFMFKDENNIWSVTKDKTFIRAVMALTEIKSPFIASARAVVNINELQKINGENFTPTGEIKVYVRDPNNEFLNSPAPITYLPEGKFSLLFTITNTFIGGIYKVYAEDVSTGKVSQEITFKINNPINYNMAIEKPDNASVYKAGEYFYIIWRDFVSKDHPFGISGNISKHYKIEITSNNGNSWTTINSNYLPKQLLGDALNSSISYNTSITNSGIYKYRITDNQNPANTKTSEAFEIVSESGEYKINFDWDASSPHNSMVPPVGLAADGVARILVKLNKIATSNKIISHITTTILPVGSSLSGTTNLGKIKFRTDFSNYNLEGNTADNTIADSVITVQSNQYVLWLLAPDDYSTDQQDVTNTRRIKIKFDIAYSNNAPETFYSKDIEIVRPPLLWVHGLNGDEGSFKNAKYLLNGATKGFFGGDSNPWIVNERVKLINYESYDKNARILLGMDYYDAGHPHNFQYFLDAMHHKGYAANRVDYICHSMGGCVARTMMNVNTYQNVYRPARLSSELYKNYDSGFVNKLITINTPNNGSPFADYLYDYRLNPLLATASTYTLNKVGFWHNFGVSNAILDLRYFSSDGKKFSETTKIKNHLISSDVEKNLQLNKTDIAVKISNRADFLSEALMKTYALTTLQISFDEPQYNNTELWDDADVVVPLSSQLAGPERTSADDITNGLFTGAKSRTIIYGNEEVNATKIKTLTHTQITDNSYVGKRILVLLNSAIGSTRFANSIPANPNGITPGYMPVTNPNISQVFNNDSTKFIIVSPSADSIFSVDSLLEVNIDLIDTVYFKKLQVMFQGNFYESESKVAVQKFQLKVNSSAIGKNTLLVNAAYDSASIRKDYFDTLSINTNTADTLNDFYVSPASMKLNKHHSFNIEFNAIYNNFIGSLNYDTDFLTYYIADTNVVVEDSINNGFITKDTGSTYIIFDYLGFKDTAYVYISFKDTSTKYSCPQGSISFYASNAESGSTYQWQVDTSNIFVDIADDQFYSGSNTSILTISGLPSNFNRNDYRCIISNTVSNTLSDKYTLEIQSVWNGSVDTSWHNSLNWNCNTIPDQYVDVIIPSGKPNYPTVCSSVNVNSLKLENGSTITVKPGVLLDVKSRKN